MGNAPLEPVSARSIEETATKLDAADKKKLQRMGRLHPVDVHQQVIGSRHSMFVEAPTIIGPADVGATVTGSAEFRTTTVGYHLNPAEPGKPIEVIFEPRTSGEHSAKLSLFAAWQDGHFEEQHTLISGSARASNETPSDAITERGADFASVPRPSEPSQTASLAPAPTHANDPVTQLGVAAALEQQAHVNSAVTRLFDERQGGVANVEREDRDYKPPTASASMWWDIAALAITIGTGGLFGALGVTIEAALKERVGAKLAKFAASSTQQLLGKAVGFATKEIENHVTPRTESSSSDEFFSSQDEALGKAKEHMSDGVASTFANEIPRVSLDPVGIGATGAVIKTSLDELASQARAKQGQATALKYLEYKARVSLGTAMPRTFTEPKTSFMADARELDLGGLPAHEYKGLLDVELEELKGEGMVPPYNYVVKSARVAGVSTALANRLVAEDLRTASIPIRFHLPHQGIITRDEAGRIRYEWRTGWRLKDDSKDTDPEAQSIRSAEGIVNVVLSKSLAAWGVNAVISDDQKK